MGSSIITKQKLQILAIPLHSNVRTAFVTRNDVDIFIVRFILIRYEPKKKLLIGLIMTELKALFDKRNDV